MTLAHALLPVCQKAYDLQQMKEHTKRAKELKQYDNKIHKLKLKKEVTMMPHYMLHTYMHSWLYCIRFPVASSVTERLRS